MQNTARTLSKIKEFRARVLEKRRGMPLFQRSLKDVRRVVIINSSSRSGSSLLYSLLCKLPGVYALSGEATPFHKLNITLPICNLYESDKIPASLLDGAVDVGGLFRDFFADLQHVHAGIWTSKIDAEGYVDDLLLRFPLQWTDADFDPALLRTGIHTALERYTAEDDLFQTEAFYLDLLEEIMKVYPGVNPYYYDLDAGKVALRFPSAKVPSGPPNSWFNIEEPPFILQAPFPKATPGDLAENTLLLKSTVDCYRMNLIEKIFPDTDIRIIHLTRNPAAATNGICDGWLHRGFFSHNLHPYFDDCSDIKELRIKGYSDIHPFGRFWWNFDLPEGWQQVVEKDLVEVAAFQWYSANREILDYLSRGNRRHLTVRHEDIVRDLCSRTLAFEAMLAFMDMPREWLPLLKLDDLPVVQSTLPPRHYRWRKRPDILPRLLGAPRIVAIAERLGYDRERIEEWL